MIRNENNSQEVITISFSMPALTNVDQRLFRTDQRIPALIIAYSELNNANQQKALVVKNVRTFLKNRRIIIFSKPSANSKQAFS